MSAALIGTPERWVRSSAMVRVFTTGSSAVEGDRPLTVANLAFFLALPDVFPRFLFALAGGAGGARGTTRSIV